MSVRVDERAPKEDSLDAYTLISELTIYSNCVCKPKSRKDRKGIVRESTRHIPMRYNDLGKEIMSLLIKAGGMVLEANKIYIAKNLNLEDRRENLRERVKLESKVIGYLFRVEHIVNTIQGLRSFHDDTLTYWTSLIVKSRDCMIRWKNSERSLLRRM